jgi:hypothetical protein
MSSTAGLGVSNDGSTDGCRIVQGTSGELKRGDKRYVQSARIGGFYFEGRNPPIIDGEEGFKCVWVHTHGAYLETPADGGLGTLAKYRNPPGDAFWRDEVDENGRERRVFRREGNRNIIQRTMFGSFVLLNDKGDVDFDELYTLRFKPKPAAAFYRNVDRKLGKRSMRILNENGVLEAPPIFGVTTHVVSNLDSNEYGDWYIPVVEITAKQGDPGGPTRAEVKELEEIYHEREKYTELSYNPTPTGAEPPAPPEELETPRPASPSPPLSGSAPISRAPAHETEARLGAQTANGPRPFAPLPSSVEDIGEPIPF